MPKRRPSVGPPSCRAEAACRCAGPRQGAADERRSEPRRCRPAAAVLGVDHPRPRDRPVQRCFGTDPVELHFEDLGHRGKVSDRYRPARIWWADASREAAMGRAVHRARDVRALHRLLGLCRRLSLRRPGLQRSGRGLQAFPRRCRRRARQLHPRPQGLHALHPGLPALGTWEPDIENHLFGRPRTDDEVAGISRRTVLARATGIRRCRAPGRTAGSCPPSSSGPSSTR